MDDILKTAWGDLLNENEKLAALLDEKAARIERLEAALKPLANLHRLIEDQGDQPDTDTLFLLDGTALTYGQIRNARRLVDAALAGKEG